MKPSAMAGSRCRPGGRAEAVVEKPANALARRRRGDARAHHGEGDQEREEVDAERLVRVERSAGRLWVRVTSSR